MIEELTALDDVVVATGGGAVLDPAEPRAARERPARWSISRRSVDAQLQRTQPSRNRPLLEGDDPRAMLEHLMSMRQPLYESIADIRVDTTGRQVEPSRRMCGQH